MNSQRYFVPNPVWTTNSNLTTAIVSTQINDIAVNGNTFIAVGASNSRAARSTDGGVTWSALPAISTASACPILSGIAYGNNVWVAVGYSGSGSTYGAAYSVNDGVTWTNTTMPISNLNKVRFVNNTFVCVSGGGALAYSSNGSSWSNGAAAGGLNTTSVAYGNSTYAVVGQSGEIQYGSNIGSLSRTQYGLGGYMNNMQSVAFGNGIFIAVGQNSNNSQAVAFSSTNASTWTALSNFTTAFASNLPLCIVYNGSKFIVGGVGAVAYSSPDGITWTSESTLSSAMNAGNISQIAISSPSLMVAGGLAGKAARFAP